MSSKMISNKEIYGSEEFHNWTDQGLFDLTKMERYYLEKYLINTDAKIIDAGTGGGRIAFSIEKMGFKNIDAFDFVPKMIEFAKNKAKNIGSSVCFQVADAKNLSMYLDNNFDHIVYLQQVLSFIPTEEERRMAVSEAYRVLKPEGTAIFSFLNWNGRYYNYFLVV